MRPAFAKPLTRPMFTGAMLSGLVVAGLLASGTAALAQQDRGTLVELFTSQGCASCPPADELLAQMDKSDGVIALALHVDYWDYIGWVDDLADPAFTARQRKYAKAWSAKTVYTPQMVVAGVDEFVGSLPMRAMDSVAAHPASDDPVTITLERAGDELSIAAQAVGPVPDHVMIQLVRYTPEVVRMIERGENAGKTVIYSNVVTAWQVIGAWTTAQDLALHVPVTGDEPIVVIVQDGTSGPVLGAVRLR